MNIRGVSLEDRQAEGESVSRPPVHVPSLFPQHSHGAKQQHASILGSKGHRASQVALVVKNPPANAGDTRDAGLIPGLGRPLEEGMATHSSILA